MIEIGLGIAVCVIMAKIAGTEGRSGVIWGSVTFLICFGCLFIPIPYLRFLIAGAIAFVLMTLTNSRN